MSDWAEFCELMNIDPNDPEQFDELLVQWSKDGKGTRDPRFQRIDLKAYLISLANPSCIKCSGSGYIGKYQHVEGGRCFECLPDRRWNSLVNK